MGRQLQADNPVVVAAFHSLLRHQLLIVGAVLSVLLIGMSLLRMAELRRTVAGGEVGARPPVAPEPLGRRILRFGFAALWILDGLLQMQQAMPLGLPTSVIQPAAAGSPAWVHRLVNFGVTTWTNHPVEAAVSVVWIQIGLGVFLLVAPRGRWSRFAGLASLAWGLVVWVFGEAFGAVFAPGLSFLFGAPGAAVFYCLAGALLALPEKAWASPALGRWVLRGMGVFFVGMAVLQAWPGRGFWQGAIGRGGGGSLVTMVRAMVQTPQPHLLSSWLSSFSSFDASHGWAVNLFVVLVLGGVGLALCTARPGIVGPTIAVVVVFALADWVLVEDLGFLGGLGTDPNSMVPVILVLVSSYFALVRLPALAEQPAVIEEAGAEAVLATGAATGEAGIGDPKRGPRPAYVARVVASVGALALVLLGAAPMAVASTNPNADPILALAVDGNPDLVDLPAPAFHLIDQTGQAVSLASLRGKTVALTFLDPVCTSDCPIIAQEFKATDAMLGPLAHKAVFVAVVANPIYRSIAFTQAFDRQEGLAGVHNWLYLTGSASALLRTWNEYSVQVAVPGAGAMVAHSDLAYLIDSTGHTREVLSTNPGVGTPSESSFSVLLFQQMKRVIAS